MWLSISCKELFEAPSSVSVNGHLEVISEDVHSVTAAAKMRFIVFRQFSSTWRKVRCLSSQRCMYGDVGDNCNSVPSQ